MSTEAVVTQGYERRRAEHWRRLGYHRHTSVTANGNKSAPGAVADLCRATPILLHYHLCLKKAWRSQADWRGNAVDTLPKQDQDGTSRPRAHPRCARWWLGNACTSAPATACRRRHTPRAGATLAMRCAPLRTTRALLPCPASLPSSLPEHHLTGRRRRDSEHAQLLHTRTLEGRGGREGPLVGASCLQEGGKTASLSAKSAGFHGLRLCTIRSSWASFQHLWESEWHTGPGHSWQWWLSLTHTTGRRNSRRLLLPASPAPHVRLLPSLLGTT